MHGVFGYSRWKNVSFSRLLPTGFPPSITPPLIAVGGVWPFCYLYGFRTDSSVSETGEGVVIHTPAYDAFYKALKVTSAQ